MRKTLSKYSHSRSEATKEVLSRGYLEVCMSVRNIVTVTFRKNVISIGILENLESNDQIATFDLSRISRTSEGGRPNAPKIATTTEYCPWVGPSVGLPMRLKFGSMSVTSLQWYSEKMSFQLEFWKISNQIATFVNLTWAELVGRPTAADRTRQRLQQLPNIVLE